MRTLFSFIGAFLLVFQAFSQKQYALITRSADYAIEGNSAKMVKLFEGELYEILADETTAQLKNGKKGITIKFADTNVEVPWGSGSKRTYDYPVAVDETAWAELLKKQYEFVVKEDSIFKIDFSGVPLSGDQAIFIASQEVKEIVKIQSKRTTQISQAYFEKHFQDRYLRIMFPKMPTMVFSPQDFTVSPPTDESQGLQSIETEVPTNYGWRNFLILLGIAGAVLLFFFRKKLLPQAPSNQPRKENIQKQKDIKPDAPASSVIFTPTGRHDNEHKEEEAKSQNIEIQDDSPENLDELPKKWKVEFEELRLTNEELLKTSLLLEKDLEKAHQKIDELKSKESVFVQLPEHEIFVKNNFLMMDLLVKAEMQAHDFYEKSVLQKATAEKEVLEKILFRYHFQKTKLKYLEKWQNVLANLQLDGKIMDKDLLNLLGTDLETKELHFVLQTDLFEQVYKHWISLLMVLFEEIRNLDKFTNSQFLMSAEMQQVFGQQSRLVIQKTKEYLGKDINYVPLFGDISEVSEGVVRSVAFSQLPLSSLYENIDIKKGQIWAIKAYHFNHTPSEVVVF